MAWCAAATAGAGRQRELAGGCGAHCVDALQHRVVDAKPLGAIARFGARPPDQIEVSLADVGKGKGVRALELVLAGAVRGACSLEFEELSGVSATQVPAGALLLPTGTPASSAAMEEHMCRHTPCSSPRPPMACRRPHRQQSPLLSLCSRHRQLPVMTHKCRGSIVAFLISMSVEPNEK
jgi:hypothetical protein